MVNSPPAKRRTAPVIILAVMLREKKCSTSVMILVESLCRVHPVRRRAGYKHKKAQPLPPFPSVNRKRGQGLCLRLTELFSCPPRHPCYLAGLHSSAVCSPAVIEQTFQFLTYARSCRLIDLCRGWTSSSTDWCCGESFRLALLFPHRHELLDVRKEVVFLFLLGDVVAPLAPLIRQLRIQVL